MSASGRLMKVPSRTYVYAHVNPEDAQASASNIMLKLAGFHSYTYLSPYEEVSAENVPDEVREHFEGDDLAVYSTVPKESAVGEPSEDGSEEEAPVELNFVQGAVPEEGDWVCLLRSATYVMVEADTEDVEGTWTAVKRQLGGPRAVSVAEAEVDVMSVRDVPQDVYQWLLYGAADRVVVPEWPKDQIENPEKVMAWLDLPKRLEEPPPYSGAYVRVVAVYPEAVRGMLCRMWHFRRDEKSGIGTVYGKYPVDVAVSVPSEKRTPHIHSFKEVNTRDWRPGLVFYSQTGEDGCPISSIGEKLAQYYVEDGWVSEKTWRQWLEAEEE